MKVGNIIGGLEVVDVKLVNKLNLIQFLKEVDSYLQKGYKLDVQSGRQVGLVLQCKMYKTEVASNIDVASTGEGSVGELFVVDNDSVDAIEEVVSEVTEQPKENVAVEPVEEVVKEEAPVAPKKTTVRSKKTAQ